MQYTLRNVPPALDEALREQARKERKSLNQVALEMLARGMGLGHAPVKRRDLSDVAGTWHEDPAFEDAIADQHRIDEDAWR